MPRRALLPVRQYLLDRMVLRPSRHPIEHPTQKRVLFDTGRRKLECFVQRNFDTNERPELLVLKFPGTAGRAERSTGFPMPMMKQQRVEVWTWNPPGYGRSEGRASLPAIADAAIQFWERVTQQYSRPQITTRHPMTTWLCGNSLGCVTALHVAATAKPATSTAGLILRNPPPLIPVVKRVAKRYPLGSLFEPVVDSLCDSMNAMSTAGRTNLPAVFLQSELDSLVLPEDQNRLIESYRGSSKLVVMDGLEHGCIATDQHLPQIETAIRWLWGQTESPENVYQT